MKNVNKGNLELLNCMFLILTEVLLNCKKYSTIALILQPRKLKCKSPPRTRNILHPLCLYPSIQHTVPKIKVVF